MHTRASKFTLMSWLFEDDFGPELGLRQRPYSFTMPDAQTLAAVEANDEDESLDLNLHALHCKWILEDSAARFEAWSASTLDEAEVVEAGVAELEGRIQAWIVLAANERWTELGMRLRDVYLDWGAKRVIWLAEELEIRQRGSEPYVAAFDALPAQVLDRTITEYLEDADVLEDTGEEEDDLFSEKYE